MGLWGAPNRKPISNRGGVSYKELWMSRMRSGTILLILAAPFALYIAWQLQRLFRGESGSPTPDQGSLPSRDYLAARHAKAEALGADVGKASAVALQFRTPAVGDAASEPTAKAVADAATKRSHDLGDLERFLAEVKDPAFHGDLKARYRAWSDDTRQLRTAAAETENWFGEREPVIANRAAAEAELQRFSAKLDAYTERNSIFGDRARVAGWRVRANARIISGIANTLKAPYDRVLALPLPLPTALRNMDVKITLEALEELKVQVDRVETLAAGAKADGIVLPADAVAAKDAALHAAREWFAAEQPLALFADPELFTDPEKPATWLLKVKEQFERTQTVAGKELIRRKVQEFCASYLPPAARLDADVILQGKREPRADVTIEYDSDAKSKPLSDLPGELNEFNLQSKYKGFDRIVWSNGGRFTGMPNALQPTPRSVAARDYSQARAAVATWTPATVAELKRKCEAGLAAVQLEERRKVLDDLVGVGAAVEWTKANTRLWTRLEALAAAMENHRVLFEVRNKTPAP
jgi:hypothetical protein